MIVMAPNSKTGLAKIENGLSSLTPDVVLPKLRSGKSVSVSLPKFKIECKHNLVPLLQQVK